jgi:hypothetical protein
MKIGHFAGDLDGGDLPLALQILVEAADQPGYEQAGVIAPLAKANEIAVGLHVLGFAGQVEDRLLFLLRQNGSVGQLVEEALKIGLVGEGHEMLRRGKREHIGLSVAEACRLMIGNKRL